MPYPEETARIVNDVLKDKVVFIPATIDMNTWLPHQVTALQTTVVIRIQIQDGVNGILVQATDGDIRYTLTDAANPSQTSGFKLWNGADPVAIPVVPGQVLLFIAEDAGARLQSQQGRLIK